MIVLFLGLVINTKMQPSTLLFLTLFGDMKKIAEYSQKKAGMPDDWELGNWLMENW